MSGTTDIKETLKENSKERVTNIITSSVRGDTPLTNSPSLKKEEDDDIRLIIDYLRGIPEGNSWMGIAKATGLNNTVVTDKLYQYEGELFTLGGSGRWQLIDSGIGKSEAVGSITKPEPTTEEDGYQGKIISYLGAHGPASIIDIVHATRTKPSIASQILHRGEGKNFLRRRGIWRVTGVNHDSPVP